MNSHDLSMEPTEAPPGDLGLAGLVAILVAMPVVLLATVGVPSWPSTWPSLPTQTELEILVRSPSPEQVGGLVAGLGVIAWGLWLWLLLSAALRVLVVLAEYVADGAAWVRSLHTFSDWLTLPVVRRAIDTTLAGGMLVRVATGSVSEFAFAPVVPVAQVHQVDGPAAMSAGQHLGAPAPMAELVADDPSLQPGDVLYTVQTGDTLGRIARQFYGSWTEYTRIYEANRGREQPTHGTLQDERRIYPGWQLVIPQPTETVETDVDGQQWYTVRSGDTLRRIASELLGSEARSNELFSANQGVAVLPDGRVLTNPDLIWPGLRLRLPSDAEESAPEPPPAPEPPAAVAAPPIPDVAPAPPTVPVTAAPTSMPTASGAPTATPIAQDDAPSVVIVPPGVTVSPANEPAASTPGPQLLWPPPDWAVPAAGVAAGAALLVAGVGLGRRRPTPPRGETDIPVRGGFAEASGDETTYEERAGALAEQVLAFAHAHGCPSLHLVGAYAGRTGVTLLLSVAPDQAQPLVEVARTFGSTEQAVRLRPWESRSNAQPGARDWRWEQAWTTVRPRLVVDDAEPPHVELLPLGLAANRRILYGDRAAIGHLLIAGQDTADVHELQASLLVDLARRQSPDELHLLTIARAERLSPLLLELPQQEVGFVDPADGAAVADVFARVTHELDRRLEDGATACGSDLMVVVDEWAELPELGAVLDVLVRHGPGVGIRLLAATTRVDDARLECWLGLFDTRLVLQVADETASVRLVGEPGAEDLDRGGELWPSLHSRLLPPVRGFRVPLPHVQQLLEQMQARIAPSVDEEVSAESAPAEPGASVDETPAPPPTADPASEDDACAAPTTVAEPASSAEAGRQLPLIRFVRLPEQSRASGSARVHVQVLAGHAALVDGETVPEPRYRFPWQLFALVASLPPGEAVRPRVMELLWPAAFVRDDGDDVDEDKLDKRLRANLFNLKKVWRAYLPEEEVERLWDAEGGVIYLNDVLVTVDLHAFLQAAQDGDRARAANPPRLDDAIDAYRRALVLYTGPLLVGREEEYPWVPELRERYQRRQREVTHRLAELLMDAGQVADAAPLWADLMRDPGPPDPERDRHDPYAYREQCARAVFACCRQLRDVGLLVRTHQELVAILRALYADAEVAEGAEPEAMTTALFKKIYAELTTSAVGAGGQGG